MIRNFLVIVCDTVRRDHLGCYGGPVETPCLDALAAESVVFENAYCSSFPTLPCRAEMFTGRIVFPYLDWGPLPAGEPVLSEVMGKARYNTALITDNLPMSRPGHGYTRGFDSHLQIRGQWYDEYQSMNGKLPWPVAEEKLGERKRVQQYLHNVRDRQTEEDYFAPMTVNAACDWLERYGRKSSFFLWVDIFDPHEPWDPPANYLKPEEQDVPRIIYPEFGQADRYTPDELEAIRILYRGELRMTDHWVGKLLGRLEELGLRDDTCVVFLSDHGIFHGEHNLLGKASKTKSGPGILPDVRGWPTYVEVSRIPMMFRVPGITPKRVEAFAHPGDVTATLLELAGIRPPDTMRTRSMANVLREGAAGPRPVAVSSWSLRGRRKTRPSVVRDAEWSLVFWRSGVPPELYHRPTDPGETSDVSRRHPAEVKRLHGEFLRFLRENETPPRNYWPRHWLVNWGASESWQSTVQQSHGAGA